MSPVKVHIYWWGGRVYISVVHWIDSSEYVMMNFGVLSQESIFKAARYTSAHSARQYCCEAPGHSQQAEEFTKIVSTVCTSREILQRFKALIHSPEHPPC